MSFYGLNHVSRPKEREQLFAAGIVLHKKRREARQGIYRHVETMTVSYFLTNELVQKAFLDALQKAYLMDIAADFFFKFDKCV